VKLKLWDGKRDMPPGRSYFWQLGGIGHVAWPEARIGFSRDPDFEVFEALQIEKTSHRPQRYAPPLCAYQTKININC
jgi:hypothetical protein